MLHDIALQEYGGLPGENEPGLIDFLAEKPFQIVFGRELYPGLFMKAAVYLHGLATNQYFCDGNKRTGVLCAVTFLLINGHELDVEEDSLYHMTIKVANKEVTLTELAEWIEKNSKKLISS
jgi:death-on-curing protein